MCLHGAGPDVSRMLSSVSVELTDLKRCDLLCQSQCVLGLQNSRKKLQVQAKKQWQGPPLALEALTYLVNAFWVSSIPLEADNDVKVI